MHVLTPAYHCLVFFFHTIHHYLKLLIYLLTSVSLSFVITISPVFSVPALEKALINVY